MLKCWLIPKCFPQEEIFALVRKAFRLFFVLFLPNAVFFFRVPNVRKSMHHLAYTTERERAWAILDLPFLTSRSRSFSLGRGQFIYPLILGSTCSSTGPQKVGNSYSTRSERHEISKKNDPNIEIYYVYYKDRKSNKQKKRPFLPPKLKTKLKRCTILKV